MEKTVYSGSAPEIYIEAVGGNLALRGWGEETVQVRGDEHTNVTVEEIPAPTTSGASARGQASSRTESDEESYNRTGNSLETNPEANEVEIEIDGTATHAETADRTENRHANSMRVRIKAPGDCSISVPYSARLRVTKISGDCNIKEIGGALSIESIGGECRVLEVGSVAVDAVGGDCLIRSADGKVTLQAVGGDLRLHESGSVAATSIGGDANIRQVHGSLALNQVGGDLRGREISGNVAVETGGDISLSSVGQNIQAKAGADAHLTVMLDAEQRVNVHAGADIHCRIPNHAAAQVHLRGQGGIVIRHLPVQLDDSGATSFVLGTRETGVAMLNLESGGTTTLEGIEPEASAEEWTFGGDWEFSGRVEDLAEHITRQVESRLENVSRHLEERFSNSDDLAARIQDKVQSAMRQAERKIAKAMEKAEARSRRAEEQMARREARRSGRGRPRSQTTGSPSSSGYSYTYSTPTPQPSPKPPGVSEEERMRILRMVENGTISVDQAEKLLEALKKQN